MATYVGEDCTYSLLPVYACEGIDKLTQNLEDVFTTWF